MLKFCENCGKELDNPLVTHCSAVCLFAVIKNSKPFTREYHRRIIKIRELLRAGNYNELLEELVAVAVLFYAMKLWTTLNEISNAAVSNRFSRD